MLMPYMALKSHREEKSYLIFSAILISQQKILKMGKIWVVYARYLYSV